MGKKKYQCTMVFAADEIGNFSLSLDFNPPLKQYKQPVPGAYHFSLLLARIVALCSENNGFAVELLSLMNRYQHNSEKENHLKEAVNE